MPPGTCGTGAALTGAQESAVGGNVTVGTNSVVTLGSDAMVNLNLTMGDGTTLALSLDNSKLEADPDFKPIGGTIKLTSGEATVKVSGDTLAATIDRLLMHGHEHGWTGDIPDRRVLGLSKTVRVGCQKVGATEIEKDDRKVFTK